MSASQISSLKLNFSYFQTKFTWTLSINYSVSQINYSVSQKLFYTNLCHQKLKEM